MQERYYIMHGKQYYINQNGDGRLIALISTFDLKSEESFETQAEKVPTTLFDSYGWKDGKMVTILCWISNPVHVACSFKLI